MTSTQNGMARWVPVAMALGTGLAAGPLLMEVDWLVRVGFGAFLLATAFMLVVRPAYSVKYHQYEKAWLVIVLVYVSIFLASFLLRPPYLQDGIWRLSAPGLMLLVLLWFHGIVRHQLGWLAMKVCGIAFVGWGWVVIALEWLKFHPDLLSPAYKGGMYLSGIGHMGTIVPLGAGLLFIVALRERKSLTWWSLAFFGLVLVVLLKKRTPLALYGFEVAAWGMWALFGKHGVSVLKRGLIFFTLAGVLLAGAYTQRDMIRAAINDYRLAEKGNYVTSLGLRYQMFWFGVNLIKEKPLTGWGPSAYKPEGLWPLVDKSGMPDSGKKLIKKFTHLHNQYIMDWVLSGIFGFLSGLAVLLYPLWLVWRRTPSGMGEHAAAAGLIIGLMFVMFFGALFTYTYTTTAIMLTLSSLVAIASRESERRDS